MEKSNTQVLIGGKIFTMSGNENEEYMQKIAAYLNRKIHTIETEQQGKRIPADMKAILIQINIADELMKEREIAAALETDLRKVQEELNLTRQELATLQTRITRLDEQKKPAQPVRHEEQTQHTAEKPAEPVVEQRNLSDWLEEQRNQNS